MFVSWAVTPCGLTDVNVSIEHTASIFSFGTFVPRLDARTPVSTFTIFHIRKYFNNFVADTTFRIKQV